MEQLFNELKDKSELMYILCQKSVSYWLFYDRLIKSPLVLTSSALIIINSYFKEEDKIIKFINIIINGINICIMAIINNMDLTIKIQNLKNQSSEFITLSHDIDGNIIKKTVNDDIIIKHQEKYDIILKNTDIDAIPEKIKHIVRKKYKGIKTLPLLINGVLSDNDAV
jgi:hypothetical protein